MDLLSIFSALWRHKFAVLPVLILMAVGSYYVMFVREPVYETTASLLLVSPPAPPTADELAADPALATANWDNPYTRNYDPGVIITIVSRLVNSDNSKAKLIEAGANPNFLVGAVARYGFSSPLAEVTGVGATPEEAELTALLVIDAFGGQLEEIQAAEGVDPGAFIDVRTAEMPEKAILRASDTLRALVGILGLGVVGLFAVVSTADAIARLRAERKERVAQPESTSTSPPEPRSSGSGNRELVRETGDAAVGAGTNGRHNGHRRLVLRPQGGAVSQSRP